MEDIIVSTGKTVYVIGLVAVIIVLGISSVLFFSSFNTEIDGFLSMRVIGIVLFLVSINSLYYAIRGLIRSGNGVIINKEGVVVDIANMNSGLILWSDVISIKKYRQVGQFVISIEVKDAEKIIDRQKTDIKVAMKVSKVFINSKFEFSTSTLKCDPEWLFNTLIEMHSKNSKKD